MLMTRTISSLSSLPSLDSSDLDVPILSISISCMTSVRNAYEKRLKYVWMCERMSPRSLYLRISIFLENQCLPAYRLEMKHLTRDFVSSSWKTFCSRSGGVVDDSSQRAEMLVA